MRDLDDDDNLTTFFLIFSLLLHVVLFGLFIYWAKFAKAPTFPKPKPAVKVMLVPDRPLQITDIAKPKNEEAPKEAKHAALYNQRVNEEQVARTPPPVKPAGQPQKTQRPKAPPEEKVSARGPKPEKLEKKEKPQEKSEEKSVEQRFGISSLPEDYFPDYKIGSHTYVNALRYPDIGYFLELKRRFQAAFNPTYVLRQHLNEIDRREIQVVYGLTVNARGDRVELLMLRPSALAPYDQFVEKIIRDSSPFTSPPTKLLDKDGLLRMSWTFSVHF